MKIKILLFTGWLLVLLALATIALEIKQIVNEKEIETSPKLMVVPEKETVHRNLAFKQRIQRKVCNHQKNKLIWNT